MSERLKSFLIYAAKCVSGALVIFSLSGFINFSDIGWCLISVLLILSPDGKDTVNLAFTRIKANVVGAGAGLLCLLISPADFIVISIAIIAVIGVCYLLKLDTGIRSALAAAVIVSLHSEGVHVWDAAIERVLAVLAGCVIGLFITWAFHFNTLKNEKSDGKTQE